jgi:hypothetical protein
MHEGRFVGLDVRQDSITLAVAGADASSPSVGGAFSSDIPRPVKQPMREVPRWSMSGAPKSDPR